MSPVSPSKRQEASQFGAKPKREFLKRDRAKTFVQKDIPPPKQYTYFINQFEENILEVPNAVEHPEPARQFAVAPKQRGVSATTVPKEKAKPAPPTRAQRG
jgi:hypothetical protein